ncbi:DNA phosphorothioation-dependent restriction protein DptF [Alteromonas ponticola]|uniref:DNA phosphorothioation-dependent restriction protein DptF n=1 Tax=Alteromonas aquimaris TaxID=2998417 RepID=A0ABT3P2Z2_9ALTE|nr:DNA phosphorothioation-dependent restriction protein DptF [Alteromonas aquimaris]MCW8107125.1 DNA phosphorothioation-dependent restriction protein DptF [Alteromonas aquimaris]
MELKQALSVLDKSSSYAVSTERSERAESELDKAKDYLYVKTQIEVDFANALSLMDASKRTLLFLCGSSGDGKSEIMTRYSQKVQFKHIDFHLDATHSYNPKLDAVETLDVLFTNFKSTAKPLVVGINLGMMAKYVKEGSEEHHDIRHAMQQHISGVDDFSVASFLSFESSKYSKFSFKETEPHSDFASDLMKKLTRQSVEGAPNPFWEAMKESESKQKDALIVTNFKILSIESVQRSIVELLMKIRLTKDQFLTARSFLDFLHNILVGGGYLFDNLFLLKSNELSEKLTSFDPALTRTEKIDRFILTLKLGLKEEDFAQFNQELINFGITNLEEPTSYVRLFYILRNSEFGNGYHLNLASEFSNNILTEYAEVLLAHQNYSSEADHDERNIINDFYQHTLFTALWRYINRSAPRIKKKQFLLSKENGVLFSVDVKHSPDWNRIANYQSKDLMAFEAMFKVNKVPIEPALPININLFDLLQRLNKGYRPNKHDKSCVLLLDELIERIRSVLARSDALIITDGNKTYNAERDENIIEITER